MQKCLKIYKYKNGIPGSLFWLYLFNVRKYENVVYENQNYIKLCFNTNKERTLIEFLVIILKEINNYIVILEKTRSFTYFANRIKKAVLAEFYVIMDFIK